MKWRHGDPLQANLILLLIGQTREHLWHKDPSETLWDCLSFVILKANVK